MVVVKIDENAAIEAEFRAESQSAAVEVLLVTGEGVDAAVQFDAAAQAGRVVIPQWPLDEIAHEVAGYDLRVVTGKKKVE